MATVRSKIPQSCSYCSELYFPNLLREGDSADNAADRVERYRSPKGARAGFSKLNEQQVREIWILVQEGNLALVEIGNRYGCSKGAVSHIKLGHTWGHITGITQSPASSK